MVPIAPSDSASLLHKLPYLLPAMILVLTTSRGVVLQAAATPPIWHIAIETEWHAETVDIPAGINTHYYGKVISCAMIGRFAVLT